MEIVSARKFRENQTEVLSKAKRGESIVLSSRVGMFRIIPVTEEDTLTDRICNSLKEVSFMEAGILPSRSAKSFIDEL